MELIHTTKCIQPTVFFVILLISTAVLFFFPSVTRAEWPFDSTDSCYCSNCGCAACFSTANDGNGTALPPPPPRPVPTLYIKNITTGAAETASSTFSIGPSDEIQLRWTTINNPTSCSVSAITIDTAFSGAVSAAGTDATVTEPNEGETRTYRISCTNAGGTGIDTIAVTRPIAPPVVSLYGSPFGGSVYSSEKADSLTISPYQDVSLRWEALSNPAHPSTCSASATPMPTNYSQGTYSSGSSGSSGGSSGGSYSGGSSGGSSYGGGSGSSYPYGGTSGGSTSYSESTYSYGGGGSQSSVDTSDFPITGTYVGTGLPPSGYDDTVYEPVTGSSRTYTITCTNGGGSASDSLVVTRQRAPVVTLYVQNTTSGAAETTSNISIGTADEVALRWTSTNSPTSCTAGATTADSQFSGSVATAGNDATITEPGVGLSRDYRVSCTNTAGTHTDTIRVTRPAQSCVLDGVTVPSGSARAFYESSSVPLGDTCVSQSRVCTNGVLSGSATFAHASCSVITTTFGDLTLTAEPTVVRSGGSSTITWDGGGADTCSLSGDPFGPITDNGTDILENITGERTLTLTCSLGSDTKTSSVKIKVLPKTQETFNWPIDRLWSQLSTRIGLQWL